jgi:KDO2-lipid IV(A) lauroyltransferase
MKLLPTRIGIALLWLLHWLPLPLLAALGSLLGHLAASIPGKRRRVVATNLALCFPDATAATRRDWLRQTFVASSRAALEHSILWWGSAARVRRLVQIESPELAHGDGKRPVIWLAPHFVGLDMGGIRLTMDAPLVSIYSRARNPLMDKLMLHGRTRFSDSTMFSRHDGVKPVLRDMQRGLPFYYLPDQDYGARDALFVPFFGVSAATVSALPRIAKLTNAQVVPVITRQLSGGRGYVARCYPAWENFPSGDLTADVLRMNAFIEDRVREMPAQYLWLHRRFKTRPPGAPALYDAR